MTIRRGLIVSIDDAAASRDEFLATVGPTTLVEDAGLRLELLRSGAVRAQAFPLATAEARLRLATWSREVLATMLAPAKGSATWRVSLRDAFLLEGAALFALAVERLMPLSVIAMQIERPFDETFVRPAAVWDVIEPWLVERFPATALLQFGRRLTAVVPGLGVGQIADLGEQLRQAVEAAHAAHQVDAAVAIGLAAFPDDARDLPPLIRMAEGAALRSSLQNAAVVVRAVPTLLLIGERLPVKITSSALLQRLDIRVLRCGEHEAADVLSREHPTAAVLDLHAPRQLLAVVGTAVARGLVPHTHFILLSPKEDTAKERERAAPFPQSTVLFGRERLGGRTLEEIALSLGLKPRRHLRGGHELPLELELAGRAVRGLLLNISESGARVVADVPHLDSVVKLRLSLPAGPVSAAARVAWQHARGAQCEAGLSFDGLPNSQRRVIAEFVGAPVDIDDDAPRATPRFAVERRLRLKLRVRPRATKASHYLALVNLAEGGCLSAGLPLESLQVGALADLHFFGPSGTLSCVGELVRRADGSPAAAEYAWRFVEMQREDFSELRRLLAAFAQEPRREQPRPAAPPPVTTATTRSSRRST